MFDACKDYNIQSMLVPYVERVLAKHNRAEVDEHLASCEECRRRLHLLRHTLKAMGELVSSGYRPSLDRHPDSSVLFSFALEQERLDPKLVPEIAAHINSCSSCQNECLNLRRLDRDYQSMVITVGTSNLVSTIRRSRSGSSSETPCVSASPQPRRDVVDTVPESIPVADSGGNFWDYWHHLDSRVNLRRILVAAVVVLLVCWALSATFGDKPDESGVSLRPSTFEAVKELPAPEAEICDVALDVEEGQGEALQLLLQNNGIPYQLMDGKVCIPSQYVAQVQQVWERAVEETQAVLNGTLVEETSSSANSDSSTLSSEDTNTGYESSNSESVNYDDSGTVEAGSYYDSDSGNSDYSASVDYGGTAGTDSSADVSTSTAYNTSSGSDYQSSAPSSSEPPAPPVYHDEPSAHPAPSAPRNILRSKSSTISVSTPKVASIPVTSSSVQSGASTSSGSASSVKSSAGRTTPKPAIVPPSSSSSPVTSVASNEQDSPVRPQVVRMGVQPSASSVEGDDGQIVRPTPRAVYVESEDNNTSGSGSWSNDL